MGFHAGDNGVDIVVPNFDWLVSNEAKVTAVVLTHGHEDHIGALPYLLRDLDVPVYGPPPHPGTGQSSPG